MKTKKTFARTGQNRTKLGLAASIAAVCLVFTGPVLAKDIDKKIISDTQTDAVTIEAN